MSLAKEKYGEPFTTETGGGCKGFLGYPTSLLTLGPVFTADIGNKPYVINSLFALGLQRLYFQPLQLYDIIQFDGLPELMIATLIFTYYLPSSIIYPSPHAWMLKRIGLGMTLLVLSSLAHC